MGIIVGIDLGTTYSAVATFDKASGTTRMLKNSFNSDTTPSVVCKDNGSIVIGADAKELQSVGNENVASFYKSWMGNDFYKVYLEDDECSPEDLSAIFLRELKRDIEESNRVTIDAAVITVPAYFNDMQREATLRAGTRAGLKVLKIINEPTAAIISYGLTDAGDKKVLVYDLGGGTFDVTVAQISGSTVTVLGTSGDHQLGGKDWDDAIKNHILASFESDFDVSIGDYPEALNELQVECERVKKLLTQAPKASASISCAGRTGRYEITREWFENETFHLLAKTEALIHKCLSDIGLRPDGSDIDEFVLVGGSTRMPQVRQLILNKYKKNAITGVDVDTVVARGAAIQAALCSERTITLSLGAAPSRPGAPAGQRRTFSLSASNIQDVIAHSLGMLSISEDRSRYLNTVIIPKNTKIPSVEQRPFKVRSFRGKNGETEVYILQGESLVPGENHVLGKYVIEGIEPQTEKETVIDIAYSYNENGMVQVSAVQRKTQKQLPVVKHEVPDDVSWMDETPVLPEIRVSSKIYLVIDVSGSMQNAMSKVNKAAKQFVKDIDLTSAKVGVIAFGNEVEMALEPSSDANHINKTIDNVTAFKYNVGKGTAGRPLGFLGGRFGSLDDKNYVVVLTDGEWWNAADEIASSKNLKNKGIEIVALGFAEADQNFLRDIASSSEAALKTDLNRMEGTFSSIAQAITEGQDRITLG